VRTATPQEAKGTKDSSDERNILVKEYHPMETRDPASPASWEVAYHLDGKVTLVTGASRGIGATPYPVKHSENSPGSRAQESEQ
jgi:hypothetical protein